MYCTQISNSTVHRFVSIDIISCISVFVVAQSDHGKTQLDRTTFGWSLLFTVPKQLLLSTAFWEFMVGLIINLNCWIFFSFAHYRSSCYFTDHLYFAGIKSLSTALSVSWDPYLNLKKKKNVIINEETNYCIVVVFTYITSSPGSVFVTAVFVFFSPSGNINCPYGQMRISCSSRLTYVDVL